MTLMTRNDMDIVKNLAIRAGQAIMKIYETNFQVETKQDNSPLTLADKTANEMIVHGLKENFPDYAILSEESKDDKSRLSNHNCFIVDPLDGTKEFVKKNDQFTVNIGLSHQHKPIFGVIYVPVTRQLYYAYKSLGAYVENLVTGEVNKLVVSNHTHNLIMVGSKSHASEKEENLKKEHHTLILKTISAGSSLKGCMIAEGKADVYYRFGLTCEWDTAAMHCIVEEAGGIFRQMDNSEMMYNRENTLNEKGFFIVNKKENIWI